jgi:hypothetical protein
MRAVMPWLDPSDEPTCRVWAELEILGAGMFVELTANGIVTEKGEPRRLLTEFRQLRTAQFSFERELGMTPAARMTLQVGDSRSRALDLTAQIAEGRKLRLAAEARQRENP